MSWLDRTRHTDGEEFEDYKRRHQLNFETLNPQTWRTMGMSSGVEYPITLFCPEAGWFVAHAVIVPYGELRQSDHLKLRALEQATETLTALGRPVSLGLDKGDLILRCDNDDVTSPDQAIRCVRQIVDAYPVVARDLVQTLIGAPSAGWSLDTSGE